MSTLPYRALVGLTLKSIHVSSVHMALLSTNFSHIFTRHGRQRQRPTLGFRFCRPRATIFELVLKQKRPYMPQPPISYPYRYFMQTPKKLVFDLGEYRSVYAETWINPESSTFPLRQEFRESTVLKSVCDWETRNSWPFIHSKWSLHDADPAEALTAKNRAKRRRGEKAMKVARRNGTSVSSKMPGAWPEQ